MEVIRSWWEVPCIAHFCHIFQKPFKLPAFEIEEFEDALLLDLFPTPSNLLVQIFCIFLDGIIDTEITKENWPLMLKLHLKWRCDNLKEKWNPLSGDKEYKDLDTYSRVRILHKLCHWRLELDDVGDLLRGMDGPSLRLEPVGRDMDSNTYWYFYGSRLYKEEAKRRKKKKDVSEEVTPVKAGKRVKETVVSAGRKKVTLNKGCALSSRKGRSKQVIHEDAIPTNLVGRRSDRKKRKNLEDNDEVEGRGDVSEDSNEEDSREGSQKEQGGEESVENNSEKSEGTLVSNGAGIGPTEVGWAVACTTVEEWNEVIETLKASKHTETKRLFRALQDFLPEVEFMFSQQEKQLKKRFLSELPRRTSDRIAIKTAIKEEGERLEALEREMQREELRKLLEEEDKAKEEEAEKKRQKRLEEALQRRKVREEQQERQRMEEESNWEKAMSGELSGRRKAAIGAAENVSEVQRMAEDFMLTDKDFDLYTAMHKILAGLRKHDEAWVFEDPVTEAIAPGYFEVVDVPMDYATVEKKVEEQVYKDKEQFISDVERIYDNCCEYNGEDSEYFELAQDIRNLFQSLIGIHFEGKGLSEEKPEGKGKKGQNRQSRSPSACKTPELTSESSSEEDSDDEDDDGSDGPYTEGEPRLTQKSKKKGSMLKLTPSLEQRLGSGFPARMPLPGPPHHHHHLFPPQGPHPPPQLYQHYMQQYLHHRMPRQPHMHPGIDMYPPGGPYPPRLPPPYPGFLPGPDQAARPPHHQGMYPSSSEPHQSIYHPPAMPPHQDMSRPMYPAANHMGPVPYPPPHPSHPAHPAHPHHAAYRQHMFYEMHYHGMDPRMMGMRPSGMGMRPGMGIRPRVDSIPEVKPTQSPHSETKSGETDSQASHHKPSDQRSLRSDSPPDTQEKGVRNEGEKRTEKKETMELDNEKKVKLPEMEEEKDDVNQASGGRVVDYSSDAEVSRTADSGVGGNDDPKTSSGENDDSKTGSRENDNSGENDTSRTAGPSSRENSVTSGPGSGKNDDSRTTGPGSGENDDSRTTGPGSGENDDSRTTGPGSGENDDSGITGPGSGENDDSRIAGPGSGNDAKRMQQMTAEQMEKNRYHQQMMLQHQRREAMSRVYPFPHLPHTAHPEEAAAAAAYYAHQYGGAVGPYPPNLPPSDSRQLEAAHHHHQYLLELEARRRHQYSLMKQAQHAQSKTQQQQREGGRGGKERSAETGQEGLEDVPDYQDSLRKYALGLGEQENSSHPTSDNKGGSEGATANKQQKKRESQHQESESTRKRKGVEHMFGLPPQHYPPPLPNGYPMPYPMPSYHSSRAPPEERRGFPSDGYYSPQAHYRMPPYPPHPNMTKTDEMWLRTSPANQHTEETSMESAHTPPAKRPRPST